MLLAQPELDPAWEYREDGGEVAELLAEAAAKGRGRGFAVLGLSPEGELDRRYNVGVRFGRGNPNHFEGWLAPARPERPERPLKPVKPKRVPRPKVVCTCVRCGASFVPARPDRPRSRCSRACNGRAEGLFAKVLPAVRTCGCGREFPPRRAGHFACSPECAGRGEGSRGWVKKRQRMAEFAAGYAAGERMEALCARLNVHLVTAKKWRTRLGLKPRPPGNNTKRRLAGVCA